MRLERIVFETTMYEYLNLPDRFSFVFRKIVNTTAGTSTSGIFVITSLQSYTCYVQLQIWTGI